MPFHQQTFPRYLLATAIQGLAGTTFFLVLRSVNAMYIDTCWYIEALFEDVMATMRHINEMIIYHKSPQPMVERHFIDCVRLHIGAFR